MPTRDKITIDDNMSTERLAGFGVFATELNELVFEEERDVLCEPYRFFLGVGKARHILPIEDRAFMKDMRGLCRQ